jgi:hypothetical protein
MGKKSMSASIQNRYEVKNKWEYKMAVWKIYQNDSMPVLEDLI